MPALSRLALYGKYRRDRSRRQFGFEPCIFQLVIPQNNGENFPSGFDRAQTARGKDLSEAAPQAEYFIHLAPVRIFRQQLLQSGLPPPHGVVSGRVPEQQNTGKIKPHAAYTAACRTADNGFFISGSLFQSYFEDIARSGSARTDALFVVFE